MYAEIAKNLKLAKSSAKIEDLKHAVFFFCDTLTKATKEVLDEHTFAAFVFDAEKVFSVVENTHDNNGPDLTIETTGLLAQVLDMIGLEEYLDTAEQIKTSTLDLHMSLSSKRGDEKVLVSQLINDLENLKTRVENFTYGPDPQF